MLTITTNAKKGNSENSELTYSKMTKNNGVYNPVGDEDTFIVVSDAGVFYVNDGSFEKLIWSEWNTNKFVKASEDVVLTVTFTNE